MQRNTGMGSISAFSIQRTEQGTSGSGLKLCKLALANYGREVGIAAISCAKAALRLLLSCL